MIEFRDIVKSYKTRKVLDNFNFRIDERKLTVIIGPSGYGKSTILKLINRMTVPDSGDILIDGKNIKEINPQSLRRSTGYVIQQVGLFPHMSVEKNIAVVPGLLGWDKTRIRKRVLEMLDLINMPPSVYASKFPHQLSGGEAQRVGVARALAGDPPVLLMDEPFAAVDPIVRHQLQMQFMRIQKELKKTILFVTHDIDEAIKLADRVMILNEGKIIRYDTPAEILKNPGSKFVHDFIGSDRALKRLSRIHVEDYLVAAESLNASSLDADTARGMKAEYIWLTDDEGILCGWFSRRDALDGGDFSQGISRFEPSLISVNPDMTLRDAFSYMLEQGIETIAVTDGNFRLLGEISIDIIEKIIFLGNENVSKK